MITINEGTVIATGGANAAGIGSGVNGVNGGTTTIDGGTIAATGGDFGAGIGGGFEAAGGIVTVNAGTTAATGGTEAAGIGGGYLGAGGTTTIDGGTVTATAAGNEAGGAAIGGGIDGAGGTTVIGAGAEVIASGGYSAIGAGQFNTVFGSLEVHGTLRLPSGRLVIPDSDVGNPEVTISSTGELVGTEADAAVGAEFTGAGLPGPGQVDNGGAITLAADNVLAEGVTVFDRHYLVAFDTPTPTAVRPWTR